MLFSPVSETMLYSMVCRTFFSQKLVLHSIFQDHLAVSPGFIGFLSLYGTGTSMLTLYLYHFCYSKQYFDRDFDMG